MDKFSIYEMVSERDINDTQKAICKIKRSSHVSNKNLEHINLR